ncbi:MAG: sigma-70 family RNA polymerase sigma factor [Synergistetes bacterium]|nr:sigma-70 family RNA polymerase sigma factor [Synergistota bacterium]MCX8127854.1 sigma-70 family RNA polymerase sigma factor [Synergistota bacterium]MDW8192116.1 sigma-70 family RNA polymerase sigma factor [Synergistota bacterium]
MSQGKGELIVKAQNGSSEAWNEIVKMYMPLIRSIVQRYFVPNMDKEDLLQEGMFGLFKAVNSFDIHKNKDFDLFLEVCVERQLITALRRATRQKDIPSSHYVPLEENININSLLREDEPVSVYYEIEKSLSELERMILKRYLEGKSYIEIAKELGCNSKAVDNALQRVKKKLRKMFDSLSL